MNPQSNSLSIVIPCLNEEQNLGNTVHTIVKSLTCWSQYELIIVNDGSRDDTKKIADRLAEENSRIIVIHHSRSKCRGGAIKSGLQIAQYEYFMVVNGKNDTRDDELRKIYSQRGNADIIIPVQENKWARPLPRILLSGLFIFIINKTFCLKVSYYNNSQLFRTQSLKAITIETDSYGLEAEVLIKLLKMGKTYIEVGVRDSFDPERKSRAFSTTNIVGLIKFYFTMIGTIYFSNLSLTAQKN